MKPVYLVSILASLLVATTSNVILVPASIHFPRRHVEKGVTLYSAGVHYIRPRAIDLEAEWSKALCKGVRLTQCMIVNEEKAAEFVTPVRSRWIGDLAGEFRTWGYREVVGSRDSRCDFGPNVHELQRAFLAMGIDPRPSSEGGPNICYHVEHAYGPAIIRKPDGGWPKPEQQTYQVDGKIYRASGLTIFDITRC
jgi:hypothetical protein